MASHGSTYSSSSDDESAHRSGSFIEEIEEVEDDAVLEDNHATGGVFQDLPSDNWPSDYTMSEERAYWRPLPSHDWGYGSSSSETVEDEWPYRLYFFWLPLVIIIIAVFLLVPSLGLS